MEEGRPLLVDQAAFRALTRDLREAIRLGREAAGRVEDVGSCNDDCLFLYTDKHFRKCKTLERAITATCCTATRSSTRYWKGYFIRFDTVGVAHQRYEAVNVACRHLQERGWTRFTVFRRRR